jgi:hypothetical protein
VRRDLNPAPQPGRRPDLTAEEGNCTVDLCARHAGRGRTLNRRDAADAVSLLVECKPECRGKMLRSRNGVRGIAYQTSLGAGRRDVPAFGRAAVRPPEVRQSQG